VFCTIAVVSGAVPLDVLPANFLGATLGASIGALITFVLLKGQMDIEEKKGRDIRILEKKMEVFQDFIKEVWKVWKGQIITIEEFQDLTTQYYQNMMIYLKDKKRLKTIGKELTAMGRKIDKNSFNDTKELRGSIVTIINTLSAELDLGGEIDTTIMEEHDKIVFPLVFRNELLRKLNEELKTKDAASEYKEGKYEFIWEGKNNEYITFELKRFSSIKLAIGVAGDNKTNAMLKLTLMNDPKIVQLVNFRNKAPYDKRFGPPSLLYKPIPEDEDKTQTPVLDFSKEESMEVFRKEKYNFPDILAKRLRDQLEQWKLGEFGIIEFLKNYVKDV
jgi:hypothetical protein